jgi:hypothetical protein
MQIRIRDHFDHGSGTQDRKILIRDAVLTSRMRNTKVWLLVDKQNDVKRRRPDSG